jgi:hypothetical protein
MKSCLLGLNLLADLMNFLSLTLRTRNSLAPDQQLQPLGHLAQHFVEEAAQYFRRNREEKSPSLWGTGPSHHGRFGTSQKKCEAPLNGAFLRTELIEQGFGVFQVSGVEALSEPAIDVGEGRARLVETPGTAKQSREARRGARLQ